jgi:GT2 family glycosyltransferase
VVKTFSIVVPTYQRSSTLRRTLEALLAVDYPRDAYRVIVVDDANERATANVIAGLAAGDRLHLIAGGRHGAATARNTGARAAEGTLLLFCDDDMIVQRTHLRGHLDAHEQLGQVMVGSNRWYSPASLSAFEATPFGRFRVDLERGFQSREGERLIQNNLYETSTLAACDMSVSRDAFWAVGGFDETFPYAGAEDQDLSIRVRDSGHRLVRNYDLTPLHDDPTVTLRQFCLREERGAETVVAFERKYPEARGNWSANSPLTRHDSPTVMARKLGKSALSTPWALEGLHRVVDVFERRGADEATLHRMYRLVLGLHIFRGYRRALTNAGVTRGAASPRT